MISSDKGINKDGRDDHLTYRDNEMASPISRNQQHMYQVPFEFEYGVAIDVLNIQNVKIVKKTFNRQHLELYDYIIR